MPATQTNRDVAVTCAGLADDTLLFNRMQCSEQLGRLYEFRIELSVQKRDINIADVLGKEMTVTLEGDGDGPRHFSGIVTRFSYKGWRDEFSLYEAIVQPALWLLTRSTNCRIFQELTALDIVRKVFAESACSGLMALQGSALTRKQVVRNYCVQYRESDFDFVCRLLEEEGIYFYFTHAAGEHTMVLADSYGAHDCTEGYAVVAFRPEEAHSASSSAEAVTMWSPSGQIQASVFSLNDFDFEKTAASTSGSLRTKATIPAAFGVPSFEHYDYPGGYRTGKVGEELARARMDVIHGQCEHIDARCSARGIRTGALFTLADHPRADQNRTFLVTSSETGIVGERYRTGDDPGLQFNCSFTAVGKEHSYRPPAVMRKPVMQGPQTAMVVGKAGEEIWTDQYGRIKVQFHWDRLGKADEASSCWVRVSQAWAGKGWGAMFIPRIGMEVVVDFLDGDPDQPLVTGCVYNSDAMPPYALPAGQTRSTIMSSSSKGGGGNNEIRFEDKKDAEELYVQAEKDYTRVVRNNDTLTVGFEKQDKGDQSVSIHNDQLLDVGHDQTSTIGNNQTIKIDGDQSVTIDGDQKTTVGKTCVIEATSSIELKVGASSIKIEPGKITIKSVQVAVQAEAMMALKAGGMVTVEGALVKIN